MEHGVLSSTVLSCGKVNCENGALAGEDLLILIGEKVLSTNLVLDKNIMKNEMICQSSNAGLCEILHAHAIETAYGAG